MHACAYNCSCTQQQEYGLNEIPDEITPLWLMVVKQFYGPMPLAIALAGIISIATLQVCISTSTSL